jgi:hypothetical protein
MANIIFWGDQMLLGKVAELFFPTTRAIGAEIGTMIHKGQAGGDAMIKRLYRWWRNRRRPMQVVRVTHEQCFAEYFGRGGEW